MTLFVSRGEFFLAVAGQLFDSASKTFRLNFELVVETKFINNLLGLLHRQAEAFQLVFNASGIFYALTYVVMFAIPLFGLRSVTPRPPVWLRVVSLSGMMMTLLYVGLSVFPIIRVESATAFGLKISMLIVCANVLGAVIFYVARRR